MDNKNIYSVWVGANEVNNYYLTKQDAIDLAEEYEDNGYDDVYIVMNHKLISIGVK